MLLFTFALTTVSTFFGGDHPNKRLKSHATHIPGISTTAPPSEMYATNDLYAIRARRRMAHYLRLRLMELHEARLERIEKVIRGELSIDDLLREP
jgi:hypothetical protein